MKRIAALLLVFAVFSGPCACNAAADTEQNGTKRRKAER